MAKKKKTSALAPSSEVEKWLGHIKTYDRVFASWESRVDKIVQRYRDESGSRKETNSAAKFNILWSNVQTLSAATFARLPKPDVSRRFKDNDPVGRVASLILERALEYEIQHYSNYRTSLKACVLDRFLGGRATAWVRYEPHFMAQEQGLPPEGEQITEDVEAPGEVLEYECAAVDYVHWRDFGHTMGRTWDEVTAVWRKVYMTRDALVSRFGDEGKKVPLDAKPEEYKDRQMGNDAEMSRGLVYEIWDKETQQAIWLSKSLGNELDRRDDPLELEEFFPCPKPIYATLANDKLEPVPDYCLYQYQARELDTCAERIEGLVDALRVRGVYNAEYDSLKRLFTEGKNNDLLPVKNWAAFAEKQGLKGAIDLVDISIIGGALKEAYLAMEQIKNQVYEITGISDIVRGQGDPTATATAERIKGNFASLRLKTYQEQVSEFATELMQIMAQVMCNKYSPQTLGMIAAVDQLSDHDKALVPQAMQLLLGARTPKTEYDSGKVNALRSFRVEIAADSLVYLDEQAEQESRMKFLAANSQFMKEAMAMIMGSGPAAPIIIPLVTEIWKFGITSFKVGKTIEGAFDEAAEKLKQLAAQPPAPPPPSPKDQADMAKAQASMEQTRTERMIAPIRAQAEMAGAQADVITAQTDLQTAVVNAQMSQMQPPMSRQ